MSESSIDSVNQSARRPNRWGVGTLSTLQLLLLSVTVAALNYLSMHHYLRWDLSRSADYSLSPATQRYLEGVVRDREEPVKWIMAYRRGSPFYERVRALAEEYQRLSRGAIVLEVVDPLRSPDRMQEVAAAYGFGMVRDLLIIDARTDGAPPVREDANRVRTLHPHVRMVVADDVAVHATTGGVRRIVGFRGEDVLTAAPQEFPRSSGRSVTPLPDRRVGSWAFWRNSCRNE